MFKSEKNDILSKLFFRLLPIQVLIIAMGAINSIVDGSIAGQFIDATTVGVVGLYFSMVNILTAIGNTFLGGTAVLCGRYMGAGNLKKTNGIFTLNLFTITIVGIVLTLISLLFSGPLAVFLGASEELKPALMLYIMGYAVGIIPQLLAQQIVAFLQLERQNVRSYIGIAGMILSNIIGDVLFVAIWKWGVLGLALATSFSNLVYFVILGQYYFTKKAQLKFNRKEMDMHDLWPLIKIGFPGAMLVLCLAARSLVINRVLLRYAGNDGLSAMSAYNMIGGLFIAYCLGVGAVVRMLVSVFIGEEDKESIKHIMKIVFTKGAVITIIITILIVLSSGWITQIFFPDKTTHVYAITKQLMIIYGACIPMIQVCCVFTNYLQAWEHHIYVNILSAFDGFFAMVIPALLLAPIMGVLGIWLAVPIGIFMTMMLTPLYCIFYWKRWPKNLDEWLFFPKGFGTNPENRLDVHIDTVEDVTKTAKTVQDFCRSHNLDEKTSYYAALCLEEMAANVVEHGYHKDNKGHSIDLHVIYKEDGVVLRMKDDCIPFNPKERAEIVDSEDPIKNIGVRMVMKIADEVVYNNLLGLNVLTMTIRSHA
ncbi:MAG: ATP-binding protein [Solobacterium sp.]|nr:ATP-binding protein [Solobacterium sp.]